MAGQWVWLLALDCRLYYSHEESRGFYILPISPLRQARGTIKSKYTFQSGKSTEGGCRAGLVAGFSLSKLPEGLIDKPQGPHPFPGSEILHPCFMYTDCLAHTLSAGRDPPWQSGTEVQCGILTKNHYFGFPNFSSLPHRLCFVISRSD